MNVKDKIKRLHEVVVSQKTPTDTNVLWIKKNVNSTFTFYINDGIDWVTPSSSSSSGTELSEKQLNAIFKADKIVIDGDGNMFLSNDGTYKSLDSFLEGYAKLTDIPHFTSELNNDKGFITEVDLKEISYTKSEIDNKILTNGGFSASLYYTKEDVDNIVNNKAKQLEAFDCSAFFRLQVGDDCSKIYAALETAVKNKRRLYTTVTKYDTDTIYKEVFSNFESYYDVDDVLSPSVRIHALLDDGRIEYVTIGSPEASDRTNSKYAIIEEIGVSGSQYQQYDCTYFFVSPEGTIVDEHYDELVNAIKKGYFLYTAYSIYNDEADKYIQVIPSVDDYNAPWIDLIAFNDCVGDEGNVIVEYVYIRENNTEQQGKTIIESKKDKLLVDDTILKTVNGQSLIGSGDIKIESDVTYVNVPELQEDYMVQSGEENKEIIYTIEVGDTVYSITGDSTLRWINSDAPVASANCTYVISVIGTFAVWGEFPKE